MLYTNLIHLETAADLAKIIEENENVLVICGKMDPDCVSVYRTAETLARNYKSVKFCDMEFDNPESNIIFQLPEINKLNEAPYIVYYKTGLAGKATSGIQSKEQIMFNINQLFFKTEKV
jgi:thioredoxin 1